MMSEASAVPIDVIDAADLARLAELREHDPDCALFGAELHRWQLGAPLAEADLAEIEGRYGFTVPDAYRHFLSTWANGGAGPGYGLWQLGWWDPTDTQPERWDAGSWIDDPAKPFPHSTAWNVELTALDDEGKERPAVRLEEARSEDDEVYAQAWDALAFAPGLVDGAIPIATLGNGVRLLLVVSGPERGNIWIDQRAVRQGIAPVAISQDGKRCTFTELYRDWLSQSRKALGG